MGKARKHRLEWADLPLEPTNGVVDGPTWDDVRAIVEHLAKGDAGFVVLSRGQAEFIQAAPIRGGLTVEHHEPASDGHFALADGAADVETAVSLFRAWYDDPASIGAHAEWEPVKV